MATGILLLLHRAGAGILHLLAVSAAQQSVKKECGGTQQQRCSSLISPKVITRSPCTLTTRRAGQTTRPESTFQSINSSPLASISTPPKLSLPKTLPAI